MITEPFRKEMVGKSSNWMNTLPTKAFRKLKLNDLTFFLFLAVSWYCFLQL